MTELTEKMTELEIFQEARQAVARQDVDNWRLGELAALWTICYAHGRSDLAFSDKVGCSRQRIQKCRQTWEMCSKFKDDKRFSSLNWSHFLEASYFEDPEKALLEAVRESYSANAMRALCRQRNGEDLKADSPLDDAPEKAVRRLSKAAANKKQVAAEEPASSVAVAISPKPAVAYAPFSSSVAVAPRKTAAPQQHQQQVLIVDPIVVELPAESPIGDPTPMTKRVITNIDTEIRNWVDLGSPSKQDLIAMAEYLKAMAELINPVTEETEATAVQDVVDEWNKLPVPFPECKKITNDRRKALKARLKDPFFRQHWREAMWKMVASPFCGGENKRQWIADIDFFLRPDTVVRLMEGAYGGEKKEEDIFDKVFGADRKLLRT